MSPSKSCFYDSRPAGPQGLCARHWYSWQAFQAKHLPRSAWSLDISHPVDSSNVTVGTVPPDFFDALFGSDPRVELARLGVTP